MATTTATTTEYKITGSFSKAIEGGYSINFSLSGGANCDVSCAHHPESTADNADNACYAVAVENRADRAPLFDKLVRHETMRPFQIVGQALYELQHDHAKGKPVSWVRISTGGSLPQPESVRDDKLFKTQFRALLSWCQQNGIPVHIPVETARKARFYRAWIGDLAVVRQSCQNPRQWKQAKGAVSCVVGEKGTTYAERIETARIAATDRRELTGRKTVVCPAILNTFVSKGRGNEHKKNDRAKCGSCVACALSHIDIVYPIH